MIKAKFSDCIFGMVLTVIDQSDLIALLLLKMKTRAQSVCPCAGHTPPDREQ